jgi:CHC2-type zinc finger protein
MIRAAPIYQDLPERRGVSRRRVIGEAKEKVATIGLEDRLCGPGRLHRRGKEWMGLCPLSRHEERTLSFTLNPEKNVFWCFGCLRGGDVVELARFAWGYDKSEAPTAAANILREFGHEIPPRPDSWFRKQERQRPTSDGIEQVLHQAKRPRLFGWCVSPAIDAIVDEEERQQELERAWSDFQRLPLS